MSWWLWPALGLVAVNMGLLWAQVRHISALWDDPDALTGMRRARAFSGLYRRIGYFQISMGILLTLPVAGQASWATSGALFAVGAAMLLTGFGYYQGPVARRVAPLLPGVRQVVRLANVTRYGTPTQPEEPRSVRRA